MPNAYDDLVRSRSTLLSYYSGSVHSGATVEDEEGSNDLTLTGDATTGLTTILPDFPGGQAIGFAGAGRAFKGSPSATPDPGGGMTVEVWFTPDASGGIQVIGGWQNAYWSYNEGKLYFIARPTLAAVPCGAFTAVPGQTYHLFGKWDGGSRSYAIIDGVLRGIGVIDSPAATPAGFITWGAWWDNTSPCTGRIERAALYYGALDTELGLEHYSLGSGEAPPPGPPPDSQGALDLYDRKAIAIPRCVAYFPGDAHAEGQLLDVSGEDRHLTMTGNCDLERSSLQPNEQGKATSFEPVGHATLTGLDDLPDPEDGITVATWLEPRAGGAETQVLFGTDRCYLQIFNNRVYFVVKTTEATYAAGRLNVQPDVGYDIVGTWDGGNLATLYVNGVFKELAIDTPEMDPHTLITMGGAWDGANSASVSLQRSGIWAGAMPLPRVEDRYRLGLPQGPIAPPRQHRLPGRITNRARKSPQIPASSPASGYGGFYAGNIPGVNWTPFRRSSVWHRRTNGATVHPRSDDFITQALATLGPPSHSDVGHSTMGLNDYRHPVYYAQRTDPLYTIVLHSYYDIAIGEKVRVPVLAKAAKGSDGHIAVVDPDGFLVEIWQGDVRGSTLSGTIGKKIRIDGSGLHGAATAAHFSLIAGAIRAPELAAGQINHALFSSMEFLSEEDDFSLDEFGEPIPGIELLEDPEGSKYVFPAEAGDYTIPGANIPPMGVWIALDYSDAEINALPIPAYRKAFARGLAHHGTYVGDTGGSGFGFQFESGQMYTSFGFIDPLVTYAQQAGIVPNEDGTYTYDLATGIDWSRLKVLVPPTP